MKNARRLIIGLVVIAALVAFIEIFPAGNKNIAGLPQASVSSFGDDKDVYPENGLGRNQKIRINLGFYESVTGKKWMEKAIETFENKFPNVDIVMTSSHTMDQLLKAKINSGNDAGMFDIFSSQGVDWQRLVYSDKNEKLERLDSLWNRKPYGENKKTLKELVFETSYKFQKYKQNDHIYGLPTSMRLIGLLYHKEYFEKNGWNQSPRTYAEFTDLCDKIKASGIFPLAYYEEDDDYKDYISGLMYPKKFEIAAENGNSSFEDDYRNFRGKQYTSPESIRMWKNIYDMGRKKYFAPGSGIQMKIVTQMLLIQHRVAMIASGNWISRELKNNVPDDFTFGFMAMPFVENPDSKINIAQAADDRMLIWAGKPDIIKKWCKEFILWLESKEMQAEIGKSGLVPVREDCQNNSSVLYGGKVVPFDIETRYRYPIDTSHYAANSGLLQSDAMLPAIRGEKNPLPNLTKAEDLFQKSIPEGFTN